MTDLTNALNRIFAWLEKNSPNSISGFQLGLLSEEIEEKLGVLPFALPEEVCELYRWRNGGAIYNFVFGYLSLLNLDRACEYSEYFNDEDRIEIRAEEEEPRYLFPLFDFDGEYFAIQGNESITATSPIFHISDCHDVSFTFINLTNMMLALAECYETGVYAVTENGVLDVVDAIEFGKIRQKYNPGTVESLYAEGW
jgi:SMI1 / KNR4 family (SUKH-1)